MTYNNTNIHFGTDGWRGVIADDFTFENVRTVALAIGLYSVKNSRNTPLVTVGYDTRFHSKRFASIVAEMLAQCGCRVLIGKTFVSTPVLSSSAVSNKAFGGVMISASHNPPEYNGIKFKTDKGCSAPEQVTKEFEKLLWNKETVGRGNGEVKEKDFVPDYFKRLKKCVDFDLLRKSRLKIVADPMFGSSLGYLDSILSKTNCTIINIHSNSDPIFGGLHPEPIEKNLSDLKNAVLKLRADAGLATDGDGDRVGVVDGRGRYLTPHQVFPLILYYLCRHKGLKGKVVQSISMGYLSQRIAKDFNLAFEEVPVGFKYIAERIINEKILFGGEESGGYGYGNYLPERDGILNSLMIIEMLENTGRTLASLVKGMENKYGRSCYLRTDFRNPGIPKDEFMSSAKSSAPDKISGMAITQIKDYDGIEFILEDESWLLMRPSGTEPVIRVYAESENPIRTQQIIRWGKEFVKRLIR